VKLLLDRGADIVAVGLPNGSSTALHLAASGCQVDIIKLLLERKANVNAVASKGTPLCLAEGGDVQSINMSGPADKRTPLCKAACGD
jgi:Ankyrin repeat